MAYFPQTDRRIRSPRVRVPQGPKVLFGLPNPFFYNQYWGFFLQMLPYAFTILILVLGSREAVRKRLGAPAALGTPYVRGARGL